MDERTKESRAGALCGSRRLTEVLLAVYLVGLTWVILFKMQLGFDVFGTMRSVNLVPFGGALVVNGVANFGEALDNLLAFVPFGLLMGLLRPRRSFAANLVPIAAVSLGFEVLQFAFAAGASDVTDLLANTAGGAVGLGLYALVRLIARSDERARFACNAVALAGTVLVLALVGVLMAANW